MSLILHRYFVLQECLSAHNQDPTEIIKSLELRIRSSYPLIPRLLMHRIATATLSKKDG